MKKWAYLLIASGAALWGLIGIFVQGLYQFGFSSQQIVTIRAVSAAVMLVTYVYAANKSLLKIKIRDWTYFVGTGIFSIVFFNWCYFTAIRETSLSIAVILLYTAPIFVALLSRLVFKEAFTQRKLISLILTFIGITFVIGYLPYAADISISAFGFFTGLGSGLGYALYSIFGKAALEKYHSLTITTYTFIFAGMAMLPVSGLWQSLDVFYNIKVWLYIVGLGFFPTVLAYMLYTKGLSYVESSRASIIATVEPLVATLVSIFIFADILTLWQIIGILLVLSGVIMIQGREKEMKERRVIHGG